MDLRASRVLREWEGGCERLRLCAQSGWMSGKVDVSIYWPHGGQGNGRWNLISGLGRSRDANALG